MAQWHLRSNRSPTGSLLSRVKKKKRENRGLEFLQTRTEERKAKHKRSRGGNTKVKLLSENIANVADPKTKKIQRSKILSVQENAANPHYVRRNVLTKGAVIKTEAGLARVVSRPGQHGVINAVLLEKK